MLRKVELKNFEAHKHTSITFAPGMNVITGSSDTGKSAIMRALLWAINNRPSGGSFKSWGAADKDVVSVKMEFDNGQFLKTRTTKNKYTCYSGDYEALRSDVPDEIREIHNIVDYNIQTQFQPYFLLQDSPGERAKKLNDLVGLSIIDQVFKKINSKIISLRSDIKHTNESLSAYEAEIVKLESLLTVEDSVMKLDTIINKAENVKAQSNSLRELILKLIEIDSLIAERSKLLKAEKMYLSAMEKVAKQVELKRSQKNLTIWAQDLKHVDASLKDDLDWLVIEEPYRKLTLLRASLSTNKVLANNLLNTIGAYRATEKKVETDFNKARELADQYADLLEESGSCPTCYQSVTGAIATKIVRRFRDE